MNFGGHAVTTTNPGEGGEQLSHHTGGTGHHGGEGGQALETSLRRPELLKIFVTKSLPSSSFEPPGTK